MLITMKQGFTVLLFICVFSSTVLGQRPELQRDKIKCAKSKDIIEGITVYKTRQCRNIIRETVTGSMTNHGTVNYTPGSEDLLVEEGYYSESIIYGDKNLKPENIRKGTVIFGVTGTLSSENALSKPHIEGCDGNVYVIDTYAIDTTLGWACQNAHIDRQKCLDLVNNMHSVNNYGARSLYLCNEK